MKMSLAIDILTNKFNELIYGIWIPVYIIMEFWTFLAGLSIMLGINHLR